MMKMSTEGKSTLQAMLLSAVAAGVAAGCGVGPSETDLAAGVGSETESSTSDSSQAGSGNGTINVVIEAILPEGVSIDSGAVTSEMPAVGDNGSGSITGETPTVGGNDSGSDTGETPSVVDHGSTEVIVEASSEDIQEGSTDGADDSEPDAGAANPVTDPVDVNQDLDEGSSEEGGDEADDEESPDVEEEDSVSVDADTADPEESINAGGTIDQEAGIVEEAHDADDDVGRDLTSLVAPQQLHPTGGDLIALEEPVYFSWDVSDALQPSELVFNMSIYSTLDGSTVFRDNTIPGSLCDLAGNCQWKMPEGLPIQQGENYEWHISVAAQAVHSSKSIAEFGVLPAENSQEKTDSEGDAESSDGDTATRALDNCGSTVTYPLTVTWDSQFFALDARTDLAINGVDQGLSVPSTGESWTVESGPTGEITVGIYEIVDGVLAQESPIDECKFTVERSNKLPSGDAFIQAKKGLDLNLSRESIWYTTNNLNLRGRVTTEAYYHRLPAFYALVLAYEATGDASYLQKGVELALRYINAGQDIDGDGFHDWIFGHKADPNALNHDHYEWRSAMGISIVAAALHESKASVSPSNALSQMKSFLERQVWDKWYKHGSQPAGESSFQGNTGSGRAGRIGVITSTLHMLTGDSKYSNFLNARITDLAQSMIESRDPGTNVMDITIRTDGSQYSYDISHCEDIVIWYDFAKRYGYDLGGRLDDAFYRSLADTLKKVIWTGQYGTYRVDGSGKGSHGGSFEEYVQQQLSAWMLLTEYDIDLFNKGLKHANSDPTITDLGGNVTYERRMLFFASLMRAATVFD